jgi:hypothetical protein
MSENRMPMPALCQLCDVLLMDWDKANNAGQAECRRHAAGANNRANPRRQMQLPGKAPGWGVLCVSRRIDAIAKWSGIGGCMICYDQVQLLFVDVGFDCCG